MARIYVASSWRNQFQPSVVELLRGKGHQVYDFRNPTSKLKGFAWSGQWYTNDTLAMGWADTGVLVLPCGNSSYIEAVYMAGRGKHVIIYIPEALFMEENSLTPGQSGLVLKQDLMYLCADQIVVNEDELIKVLCA